MTVFANKQTFNDLGLEQVQKSHAHASQDCSICQQSLAVHPTKTMASDSNSHTAVRITACGHIIGKECLDAWLDVGYTCPICNRLLFEATGDPITQGDVDIALRTLGPEFGEDAVMVVVARLMARQEQEHARLRRAHEIEMEKMKAKETQAENDGFTLSEDDLLDSDEGIDFGEVEDGEVDEEEYEAGEDALDSV